MVNLACNLPFNDCCCGLVKRQLYRGRTITVCTSGLDDMGMKTLVGMLQAQLQ